MAEQFRCNRPAATLVVVLLAAVLSACGTGDRRPSATRAQAPLTSESSSAQERPVARSHSPVIRAGRTIRSFSGTGTRTIGSLSQKTATVLQWSASGSRFQLFTAQGFLLLDSRARTGRVRLAPGDYSRLHVASPSRWTLVLRASA